MTKLFSSGIAASGDINRQEFIQEIEKALILVLSSSPTNTAIGNNRALIFDSTCYERYKEFLCAMNFPICNITSGETLAFGKNECLNYVAACGYTNNLCSLTYVDAFVIFLFIY